MKLFTDKTAPEGTQVVVIGALTFSSYAEDIAELLQHGEKYYSNFMTIEYILSKIRDGLFQAWIVRDKDGPFLCVITEILFFPNRRVLHILQIGGTKSIGLYNYQDVMENWAILMGCTHIEAECRDAFVSLLGKNGFEKRAVVMTKTLTNRRIH